MRLLQRTAAALLAAAVLVTGVSFTSTPPAQAITADSYGPLLAAGYAVERDGEIRIDGAAVAAAASELPLIDSSPVGYKRELFPHWRDGDGNGCDMRNDILARDLTDLTVADDGCIVLSGRLDDPYTGTEIEFVRGQATSSAVQIDHVVALATAWTGGAHAWTPELREQFANDPVNLFAVDGPTNQRKSHLGPSEWLPPNLGFRCAYVATYTSTLTKYDLAVTEADRDALVTVASGDECRLEAAGEPGPGEPESGEPGEWPEAPTLPDRIAGPNRFATASAVAGYFPTGGTVVVTTGSNYADALAAGPVAAKLNAPILLVTKSTVPSETRSRLGALAPSRIIVVGSTSAVSESVAGELAATAPGARLERIGGAGRHETAQLLAERFFPDADQVLLATGWNFPDALSASAAGAAIGAPVLLGTSSTITQPTADYLATVPGASVWAVGGSGVLAPNATTEAQRAGAGAVRRLSGGDRYATAVAVMKQFFPDSLDVLVVKANNWPDALVAAPLAGWTNRPLALSLSSCTGEAMKTRVSELVAAGGRRTIVGNGVSVDAVTTTCVPPRPPAPQPPAPRPPAPPAPAPVYQNCTDVWNRLGRPIYRHDPGFQPKFDRDGDGVGCEHDPRRP